METLLLTLVCYLGFGALTCATPRPGEWTPAAQWQSFRASFRDVLTWPVALWRDFGGL